jgi:hypothetical protein
MPIHPNHLKSKAIATTRDLSRGEGRAACPRLKRDLRSLSLCTISLKCGFKNAATRRKRNACMNNSNMSLSFVGCLPSNHLYSPVNVGITRQIYGTVLSVLQYCGIGTSVYLYDLSTLPVVGLKMSSSVPVMRAVQKCTSTWFVC